MTTRLARCKPQLNTRFGSRSIYLDASKFASNASPVEENSSLPPDTSKIKNDVIGPPKQSSNLRPIVFYIPEKESEVERHYRLEREKVQRWNDEFWVKHNSSFIKENNQFRLQKLESSLDKEKKTLNAEEMSEFYKAFLDKNWKRHVSYNFEWYHKNFNLLYLAFKVQISKLPFWRR